MPLNEPLYSALERVFGHVEIVDAGATSHFSYTPNWHRGGRPKAEVFGGEYYKVSCPFCGDDRKRLWFNNQWAVRDPRSRSDMLHLVICYNEQCLDTRPKQIELRDLVFEGRALPSRKQLRTTTNQQSPATREIKLPGPKVRITNRKRASDAIIDLEERDFNLQELRERWCVYYSLTCSDCEPKLYGGRIVFPVFHIHDSFESGECEPVVVGWQARAIEPVHENEPKYLTARGMRKSQYLYGLTTAIDTNGPLVVCEGATDVWRLGTNAVALFGKDLSPKQLGLVAKYGMERPVVVFLDSDASDKSRVAAKKIRDQKRAATDDSPVVIARAPKGKNDVGDCSRSEAWRAVARALDIPLRELPVDWRHPAPVQHPKGFEAYTQKKAQAAV